MFPARSNARHPPTMPGPPIDAPPPHRIAPARTRRARSSLRRRSIVLCAAVLIAASPPACSDRSSSSDQRQPLKVLSTIGMLGDTPGRFAYPRAIDFDHASGTLWVVDRSGRVQELDPDTGACLTIFKMPDTELGFPVGITVAPGLNARGQWTSRLLYLADTHYHRVVVVEPPPALSPQQRADARHSGNARVIEPAIVRMHGRYGFGPGELIYPTDVAVLPDASAQRVHRLYVSEYGSNDRISVYDGDFNFLFSFGAFGASESPDAIEFNRPQALVIDDTPAAAADVAPHLSDQERADPLLRDKRLIVLDSRNHRVGVFTLSGRLIRWLGSPDHPTDEPGRFRFPFGITLQGDGTALVCDFSGGRIQHVDLQTGRGLNAWGKAGVGPGELNSPWAMTRLTDRRVFVVDGRNNRLVAFRGP